MKNQSMDRGGSDALRTHLEPAAQMEVRQTRRGWLMELCCPCEARTEMKYFVNGQQFATSLEESNCFCRMCCKIIHPFTMTVKELTTEAEIMKVERPLRCAPGSCKCCCYQEASFSSAGQSMGSVKEDCYFCVPAYKIYDPNGDATYKVHPPTCCGGCCVNCCAEGNPCFGRGCCKVPFHIFPASQEKTDDGAPYVGKILKKPKSLAVEIFTDANAFELTFPEDATVQKKAAIMGTSVFLNAAYFEGDK